MEKADEPACPALDEGLIALVRLLGRLAAREHFKQQNKLSTVAQSEEKSCN